MPSSALNTAIRLLHADGKPMGRIALILGCDLSTVRRALDPHAQELHELWLR